MLLPPLPFVVLAALVAPALLVADAIVGSGGRGIAGGGDGRDTTDVLFRRLDEIELPPELLRSWVLSWVWFLT